MRYLLTVVAVEDDTTPADVLEDAATDMWGELYPSEDVDPISVTTRAAVLVDAAALDGIRDAIEVGMDGLGPDAYLRADAFADALTATIKADQ